LLAVRVILLMPSVGKMEHRYLLKSPHNIPGLFLFLCNKYFTEKLYGLVWVGQNVFTETLEQ
jgi:hypothetical protein